MTLKEWSLYYSIEPVFIDDNTVTVELRYGFDDGPMREDLRRLDDYEWCGRSNDMIWLTRRVC